MTSNGRPKKGIANTFENLRADYDMSRDTRFVRKRTGLAPQGSGADYHIRNASNYYRDIEKARDMDRNDAVVGQIIDRAVANEIQEGFTLDPKTGDTGLDAAIFERWQDFSHDPEQCDIAGEMTFSDYESASSRASKLDGDCVITGTQDGPFQFHEAHTIGTNQQKQNVVLGVELSAVRKRLRYYVAEDLVDPFKTGVGQFGGMNRPMNVRDSNGVRQLFHVYNPKRTTLTRGVTSLAPIFQIAGMFEDINFAKVLQQQVVSCFAIFRKRAFIQDGSGLPSTAGYGESSTETTSGGVRQIEGISPGMELIGAPGEELEGFSPNVPNAEFFDHVKLMLTLIGTNLGLPLCLVLMDGSETNFSGWRGAVDEARKGFKANQRNQIKRFNTPAYLWKLTHFLADDPAMRAAAAMSGVDITKHVWHPQAWPYIEPVKDAQGDLLQVRNGLNSPRRIQNKNGRQWEDISSEIIEDNSIAIIKAKKQAEQINAQYSDGQPVHWRELISLPTPDGVQVAIQPQGNENA